MMTDGEIILNLRPYLTPFLHWTDPVDTQRTSHGLKLSENKKKTQIVIAMGIVSRLCSELRTSSHAAPTVTRRSTSAKPFRSLWTTLLLQSLCCMCSHIWLMFDLENKFCFNLTPPTAGVSFRLLVLVMWPVSIFPVQQHT